MASCSVEANSLFKALPDIGKNHNQLMKLNFPKRILDAMEITHCSFQLNKISRWSWIHYDEASDIVFCSICLLVPES